MYSLNAKCANEDATNGCRRTNETSDTSRLAQFDISIDFTIYSLQRYFRAICSRSHSNALEQFAHIANVIIMSEQWAAMRTRAKSIFQMGMLSGWHILLSQILTTCILFFKRILIILSDLFDKLRVFQLMHWWHTCTNRRKITFQIGLSAVFCINQPFGSDGKKIVCVLMFLV